jgi:Tfp pilus assembly protein PilN
MTGTAAIRKLTSVAAGSSAKLKDIWMPLQRLLTLSLADDAIAPQKNLSVSLERDRLSVAYGYRFLSRITVKGTREYLFEKGKYPQPEELVSSLALAVNEFGSSRENVTLSIPRAWAIIKTAEFPSTIKENISDVVAYEMDRLTPFMPEEVFYDFRVLNDTGERLTLLIMVAKADTIRPYLKNLNESGFTVGGLTVNIGSVGTLLSYGKRKTDTLFVEIDGKRYEGALFIGGSPTHIFSDDLPDGDERAEVDTLSKELIPLIDAAKTHRGKAPQLALLVQGRSPHLRESLKAHMEIPVRLIEEMDLGIKFSRLPKEIPYAAVGSVVQSLWPKAQGFNLLKKGIYAKQRPPIVVTIILALSLAALCGLYLLAPLKIEGKRLREITSQIDPRKVEARKVETLKKEAEALGSEIASINDFKEARPMDLDILKELTIVLPKNAWLTRLRITDTIVEIEGYAHSATTLFPKLEGSKYMRKVEFASPTFRDVKMDADRFSIKMEIKGAQKKEDTIKGNKGKSEKK